MAGYAYRLPRRYRYRYGGRSGNTGPVIAVAAAAVLLASGGAKAVTSAAAGVHGGPARGGTLSCSGLEALWTSAGGSRGTAFTAAEVAMAESGGRQYATLHNTDGSTDRGYFQINSVHGGLSTFDPSGNARAAVQISQGGTDWSPWTTYQTGAYAGRC